ncbi:MAG: dienelactone hydrolase family protein [Firmicutes bacterium]|nr:dienelactone hydrolase family protein [Alicyclobacillaceae bacterium]MCL6497639.1 dienelactone hydrolase family protein [Bacillota bacterium]
MTLHYLIRPAPSPDADGGTLLLLHGRGADEYDLMPLAEGLPEWLTVVTVRAPRALHPGYQWYEMEALGVPEASSFAAALAYVAEAWHRLAEHGPALARPWFLGGFSQGALMAVAAAMGQTGVDPAGVVALSGYLPDTVPARRALTGLPIFWGHGLNDPVLPFAWGEQAARRLKELGAAVEFRSYAAAHAVTAEEVRDLRAWLERVRAKR